MDLNKRPDAAESAQRAANEIGVALGILTEAREWAVAAGAHPARKGIAAAAIKLEGWRRKLQQAADKYYGSSPLPVFDRHRREGQQ